MGNNSIYDFYEKVSDRLYVAIAFPDKEKKNIKYIWEPMARKVEISGFEKYDLFLLGEKKYLTLYEGITGSPVLRQCDMQSRIMRRCRMKLFIDCLPAEIKKRGGNGFLNRAIINFLVDYDHKISPRYKVKE